MAVVVGTNAGFVSSAPVADPGGTTTLIDTQSVAIKDTSSADAATITEIGWWCDNATEETNFEVGLYSHDADNDKPDIRLYVEATNAKGTDAGWKTVSVNWEISSNTTYWIAIQVDDTATTTNIDRNADGGDAISIKTSSASLTDPWGASTETVWARAIYALESSSQTHSLVGPVSNSTTVSGALGQNPRSFTGGSLACTLSMDAILSGGYILQSLLGSTSATTTVSGIMRYNVANIQEMNIYRRLCAAGNNEFWYEDI